MNTPTLPNFCQPEIMAPMSDARMVLGVKLHVQIMVSVQTPLRQKSSLHAATNLHILQTTLVVSLLWANTA